MRGRWIFVMLAMVILAALSGCQAAGSPPTPTLTTTLPDPQSDLYNGKDQNWINALLVQGKYLWSGTAFGLYRWDTEKGTSQKYTTKDGLADNYIWAMTQDNKGNLWFATVNGVSRYDGVNWKTFTTKDGLANDFVTTITSDKQGNIWCGTFAVSAGFGGYAVMSNGISRFDGKTWQIFNKQDGLLGNDALALFADRQGNIWFATVAGSGNVACFDGNNWRVFTDKDSPLIRFIHDIYQDREGNLWMATDTQVIIYDGNTWQPSPIKRPVRTIFQDDKGIIWSAFDTLTRYDGSSLTQITTKDGLAGNDVYAITQDQQGNLWFGTDKGLSRYDGTLWKTFTASN